MRSLGHWLGCRLDNRYDWMTPRESLVRVREGEELIEEEEGKGGEDFV